MDRESHLRSERMRDMMTRAVSFDNVTAFAATPLSGQAGSFQTHNAFPVALDGLPSPNSATGDRDHDGMRPPKSGFAQKRLAIVMVGLPARGKSHIAKTLERYLNWLGFASAVWNVGNYRRMILGGSQRADFFDPNNEDGARARMELARECLNDMLNWFESGGVVGIYDATNSTVERRRTVRERLEASAVRVLFLESICTDDTIVQKNIAETKLRSPDYRGADPEVAVRDFTARIKQYVSQSETVQDSEKCSYIKIVNVGKQIILNDIQGYVQAKIVSFLLNTHITRRSIYLTRHGESEWNVSGKLGGDPNLTVRGRAYALRLAEFIQAEFDTSSSSGGDGSGCSSDGEAAAQRKLPAVWTSQLKRTRQTVKHIPTMNLCWRALNEIDAGVCEGLTYDEVAHTYPEVAAARKEDKLHYRYPGGESYVDVIYRLEPVILELERQRGPVLIVAHNAVIRSIYGYFTGKRQVDCPNLDIPLHTVFKLTTTAYGAVETRFPFDVDNVDANKTPESTTGSGSAASDPDAPPLPILCDQLASAAM
jgi:broad specificity phosphatase PhoE/predicted kinase